MSKKDVILAGPDILFPDTFPKDTKVLGSTHDFFKVQHIIELDNGLKVSAIRGDHTYGGPDLWEIAPMETDGEFIGQSEMGWNDDVLGHLSLTEVHKYCTIVSEL